MNFLCLPIWQSDDEVIQARCHYTSAEVDGRVLYNLYDDARVKVSLFLLVNLNVYSIRKMMYCVASIDEINNYLQCHLRYGI